MPDPSAAAHLARRVIAWHAPRLLDLALAAVLVGCGAAQTIGGGGDDGGAEAGGRWLPSSGGESDPMLAAPIDGWSAVLEPEAAFERLRRRREELDERLRRLVARPDAHYFRQALRATLALRARQLDLERAQSRLNHHILADAPGLRAHLASLMAQPWDPARPRRPDPALDACLAALDGGAPPPDAYTLGDRLTDALAPGEVAIFYQRHRPPGAAAPRPPSGRYPCDFPRDPGAGTVALVVGRDAQAHVWWSAVDLPGDAAAHDSSACALHAALAAGDEGRTERRAVAEWALWPVLAAIARHGRATCRTSALRLAIAPDAELHRVPFHALPMASDDTLVVDGACTVRRVGGVHDFAPSPAPRGRGVLVASQPLAGGGAVVTMRSERHDYGYLPRAVDEAGEVRGLLCDAGLCAEADGWPDPHRPIDKAALLERLGSGRAPAVLHLAMHGDHVALDGPWDARMGLATSWLVLGRPAGDDAGAVLTAAEAARALDLWGTRLVFLSACRSGRGVGYRGEGLFGVQRAFHAAGADRVVSTLWKVDDAAAREFATRFYTLWLGEAPASGGPMPAGHVEVAFRDALRWMQGRPGWSAFVLSGRRGAPTAAADAPARAALAVPEACRDRRD